MPLFGFRRKDEKRDGARTTAPVSNPAKSGKIVKAPTLAKTKAVKTSSSPTVKTAVKTPSVLVSGGISASASSIIRPRITEKSGILAQGGVYTFEVSKNANKSTIAKAIKDLYKVTPVRISMINMQNKNVFIRGRRGTIPGIKKALVTVKKGDKIEFV